MHFIFNSFLVYFFSFLFNKLYFNIFKVLRKYIFFFPKLYSTYVIKKKIYYFSFLFILCIIILCKIYIFIYIYIYVFLKFLCKIYINIYKNFKNKIILDLLYLIYWFNLLIHLKVLSKKYQNEVDSDLTYYSLKWNCYYYWYYIKFMLKDLFLLLNWYIRYIKSQLYIFYVKIIYYLKLKYLKINYYYKLFVKGFIGIYCYSFIILSFKNKFKFNKPIKKSKKVNFLSKIKFLYYRNKRLTKDIYYNQIKTSFYRFIYFINNSLESIYFMALKTGANYIIYYFYKIIKYCYSICVYIWKSDIIYRFFKLIERKKW